MMARTKTWAMRAVSAIALPLLLFSPFAVGCGPKRTVTPDASTAPTSERPPKDSLPAERTDPIEGPIKTETENDSSSSPEEVDLGYAETNEDFEALIGGDGTADPEDVQRVKKDAGNVYLSVKAKYLEYERTGVLPKLTPREQQAVDFIERVRQPPKEPRSYRVVTATKLIIRNGPGVGAKRIGSLDLGDSFIVCGRWGKGRTFSTGDRVRWYRIATKWGCDFESGKWVAAMEVSIGADGISREFYTTSSQPLYTWWFEEEAKKYDSLDPAAARRYRKRAKKARRLNIATLTPQHPLKNALLNCGLSTAASALSGGLITRGLGGTSTAKLAGFIGGNLTGTALTNEKPEKFPEELVKSFVAGAAGIVAGPLGEFGVCVVIA